MKAPIISFIPKYYGMQAIGSKSYLILENLLHGLESPCVCDLKMGQQTYDEDASEQKKMREMNKYPPQEEIGFRIVGMKVVDKDDSVIVKSKREWCMSISAKKMPEAIERFFVDKDGVIHFDLVKALKKKLGDIQNMLRENPIWRIYGSSLLVVYDAKNPTPETLRVSMIDFAHVFKITDGGRDDGYLHGLRFLEGCLDYVLENESAGNNAVIGRRDTVSGLGDSILKLEHNPVRFDTEVAFYNKTAETQDPMAEYMPRLLSVNQKASPREAFLSNAALICNTDPELVSQMEIKMGLRTYAANAANEPITSFFSKYAEMVLDLEPRFASETWKSMPGVESEHGPKSLMTGKLGKRDYLSFRDATTTSAKYGFRLTSLKHEHYTVSQDEARRLALHEDFVLKVARFLSTPYGFNLPVAISFLNQLIEIRKIFLISPVFQAYDLVGTSLLFLHSGENAVIKWVDFAKTSEGASSDHNGIALGIDNLIQDLRDIIDMNS
mmetsp:Transcript_9686/g.11629  ORF Transcript_9686/g.11629 Transcript_9686/m.11629 type:complete len:496 (+) Transcript_9686:2-1489(+)